MARKAIAGAFGPLAAAAASLTKRCNLTSRKRRPGAGDAWTTEARYRLMADHSGDVIMLLGLDGVAREVSASVREVLGFAPAELIGRKLTATVEPDDHAIVEAALAALCAGAGPETLRYRLHRTIGPSVWIEARIRGVRDPANGAVAAVVANLRDITVRQCAEAKMTQAACEFARLAATDALTGLANRRQFDETLEREWRRAAREQLPLSLLMVDADCFKLYNDTYGHQEGDAVLRQVAECIRQQTRRAADSPARYGGEEFAVILPATDGAGALLVAENICRGVRAAAMPHAGSPTGMVTVSVGVASMLAVGEADCASLTAAADAALYVAKRAGRDCAAPAPDALAVSDLAVPSLEAVRESL